MALIKCPECGKEISDKAISCPYCGFPIQQELQKSQNNQNMQTTQDVEESQDFQNTEDEKNIYDAEQSQSFRKAQNQNFQDTPSSQEAEKYGYVDASTQPPKKKRGCCSTILYFFIGVIVFFIVLVIIATVFGNDSKETDDTSGNSEGSITKVTEENLNVTDTNNNYSETSGSANETDWLLYYADKGVDVKSVDADVLYQYGEDYSGDTVYTAFTVADTSSSSLKANTDSNDSFFFSIVCDFDDSDEIKGIEEDDAVAVIGLADADSTTVTLSSCHIVATGGKAKEVIEELSANSSEQIEYAEGVEAGLEAEQAAQDASDKQAYIDECVPVNYSEVERDPDNYKDMKIVVSGEVIQVSEGFLNSVTLRVEQSDGNIWYVTYSRDDGESRILEGDSVTIYGTCKGVTTYTSVLGGQITIPSVKAEYIN